MERSLALLLLALSACTSQPAAPPSVTDQEAADVTRVADRYKNDGIMGVDVKGSTAAVSADAQKWSELDDDRETEIKAALLSRFASSWQKHNSGKRGTVTVLFRNYYGEEITHVSKRV